MTRLRQSLLVTCVLLLSPVAALAQASITGVVRDTSGAVLPGVTVEASSAVLIEKVRAGVTDGGGQYRIVDLRPGAYTVTFTLAGFSVVRLEGIELAGTVIATANAVLRVGTLEETITVTGETPLVDVQSVTRQRVVTKEVIDTIPTSRFHGTLAALIPGVSMTSAGGATIPQDVGGTSQDQHIRVTIHGSRNTDQRVTIGGVTFGEGNGQSHGMGPNVANMAEVTIDTSAVDASQMSGGVRMNFIPREGGNTFSGGVFFSGANSSMQSDNVDQELRDLGVRERADPTKKLYDISPTFGGPIARDRLWFFASWRRNLVENYVLGKYANKNLDNPSLWTYEPDLSQQAVSTTLFRYASARVTWQATGKHKIAIAYDFRDRCGCPNANATTAPESTNDTTFAPFSLASMNWTAPLTNRLLLDGGVVYLNAIMRSSTRIDRQGAIVVVESAPLPGYPSTYRGNAQRLDNPFPTLNSKLSGSYVTGAHAFSSGIQLGVGRNDQVNHERALIYNLTRGVPTSVTLTANPVGVKRRLNADLGIYAQDRWTVDRLTLNLGVRFDYINTSAPETTVGPSPYTPNRNITFPDTPLLKWKDISPKMGVAFDLFGNGRTALKGSLNRYVAVQGANGFDVPANTLVNTANRTWIDGNSNFVPDCDLTNPALQDGRTSGGDLCGAFTGNNVNFGRAVLGERADDDIKFGWGKRAFNWEFSTGVQHQLGPRVSMDIGFFRRWYGNFLVTDNQAISPSDYSAFSVTAPVDPRLPDGGGYTIAGFKNINPGVASVATDNLITFAQNYGKQIEHWNGFDVTADLRLTNGLLVQGGTSTGRTTTDNCEILEQVPESGVLGLPFCHQVTAWLTQVKGLASYRIPRVDVQVAGTFQSIPGLPTTANYVASNAQVQPSLGRPLAGNAQNITVNVVAPGTLYAERVNQIDVRLSKILRFGRSRSTLSVDLYNLTNGNTVLTHSNNYSNWLTPQAVMQGRLLKITAQLDF